MTEKAVAVVGNSFWNKVGTFFKDNWLSVVGTLFSSSTSSSALDKANRLFEVLSIDNDDGTGLFYIDIS